jgi:hypothetical protein
MIDHSSHELIHSQRFISQTSKFKAPYLQIQMLLRMLPLPRSQPRVAFQLRL